MKKLNPYLSFGGNCREAMNFYKACLGGELFLQVAGESPMGAQVPPEAKQQILHSSLVSGEVVIMASDMIMGGKAVHGNTIALSINCSSEEEIQTLFAKLSAGGQVDDPLKEQFWGAVFGALTDKFGIKWLLNCEKNQKK